LFLRVRGLDASPASTSEPFERDQQKWKPVLRPVAPEDITTEQEAGPDLFRAPGSNTKE